ncbi:glycosyltransferase [Pseudoroseomonas globiformis]|uniref:Glycosyltransferase n=1 Tax=Teichococcus globiformis TaxID=2307229 RepID=A0ABV7G9A0_9PROT
MPLHSILLAGGTSDFAGELPFKIAQNLQSFRDEHPGFRHRLYGDESLRAFLEAHFGAEVVAAYDELVPLAYKADLGRYCLLHALGGIYSDVSNFFMAPLLNGPRIDRLHVFRDNHSAAPWIVNNAIIASPPGAPVFARCIERICAHAASRHYGTNALCPTGPNLFGAELAASATVGGLANGRVVLVNPGAAYEAFAFVSAGGELVAVRRKTSPGLASLGFPVASSYAQIYDARGIYRGDLAAGRRFPAVELAAKGWLHGSAAPGADGSVELSPQPGIVISGPYVALSPGRYTAAFRLRPSEGGCERLRGAVDVVCGAGHHVLAPLQQLDLPLNGATSLNIGFELEAECMDVEIRLWATEATRFRVAELEIGMAA